MALTGPAVSTQTTTSDQRRPGDGLAVASLVLGILACLSFWIFPVCLAFAGVGFALGRVAQRRLAIQPTRPVARSWATAGVVLSAAGFLLSLALTVSCFVVAKRFASDEGQKEFGKAIQEMENDPEFKKQLNGLHDELEKLDEKTEKSPDKPADHPADHSGDSSHPPDERMPGK